jgi:hypothetical protein
MSPCDRVGHLATHPAHDHDSITRPAGPEGRGFKSGFGQNRPPPARNDRRG